MNDNKSKLVNYFLHKNNASYSLVKTMLVVVTSVSSLVHLYSIGYMENDHNWDQQELYKARLN